MEGIEELENPPSRSKTNVDDSKTRLPSQKRPPSTTNMSNKTTTPISAKQNFSTTGSSDIFSIRSTKSLYSSFESGSSKDATPFIGAQASRVNNNGPHTFPAYPIPRQMQSAMQESPTPQGRSSLKMYFPESPTGMDAMQFYSSREIDELKDGLEWYKTKFKNLEERIGTLTIELHNKNKSLARVRKEREILEKQNIYLREKYEKEKSKMNATTSGTLESPGVLVSELHKRFGNKRLGPGSIGSSDSAPSPSQYSHPKSPSLFRGAGASPLLIKSPKSSTNSIGYQASLGRASLNASSTFRNTGKTSTAGDSQNHHKPEKVENLIRQGVYMHNEPVWFFRQLFESTLLWAQRFVILPIDLTGHIHPSSHTKSFIDATVALTHSLNFDDILQSIRLRPTVIAGVINVHIVEIMSSSTLDSFHGYECDDSKELAMIKAELSRKTGRPSATATHAMLQRHAAIWIEISKEQKFWDWVQQAIDLKVELNFNMFFSMIPQEMQQNAFDALQGIFRNVYSLAINMKKLPKEWDVVNAKRNERWIPETMDQIDVALDSDSRLRLNNGFYFIVRFGVAPSIIEKDHSTGIVRAFHRHRQQVILMENPNPRREPRTNVPNYQSNKGKSPGNGSRPT